jgi:hypothetical protein
LHPHTNTHNPHTILHTRAHARAQKHARGAPKTTP